MHCLLQQHLPPQQQQWQDPQRSGYATQSAPYAPSSTRWQQPQQQQLTQLSQQQQMTGQKAELESLVQQLTPQQRQHLATMPHDKRMQFFMNLRNQMARAQQAQQLQQQQQMSQRGAWQQGPGLQQAGPGAMRQPSASAQPATQVLDIRLPCLFLAIGCEQFHLDLYTLFRPTKS